ncbi:flagellar brake protein [Paenibacillus senegalensis]|uniref:flagellar brake protein n=1 Tax=Paenibacillus senegalensis TaxID=1465766 RepID=UPI000288800E|nr:flagellar brake protein [Paenibacillus senegalensis]
MEPQIAQELKCQFSTGSSPGQQAQYRSRLADYNSQYIMIDIPIHCESGKLTLPYIGDELRITYTRNGRSHSFLTSVLGHLQEPVPLIVVKRPRRREIFLDYEESYFKMDGQLELAVKGPGGLHFVAITEQVSGDGVTFSCESTIKLIHHEEYHCWLLLHTSKGNPVVVDFRAELVRSLPITPNGQVVQMTFTEIKEQHRQEIVRYCFEKQRRTRKA